MATYDNMNGEVHIAETFDGDTFTGTVRGCNLSHCMFKDCTFGEGFRFQGCNLIGCDGIADVEKVDCSYMSPAQYQSMIDSMSQVSPDFVRAMRETL